MFRPSQLRLAAFAGVLGAALLLPGAWAASALAATTPTPASAPAAYVNQTEITYGNLAVRTELYTFLTPSEANQFVTPQVQNLILQRMVQEALVIQAAAKAKLPLGRSSYAAQASKTYAGLVGTGYSTPQAMTQALKADHLTQPQVTSYVELQMALDGVLQKLIKQAPVPASAIRAYYNAHLSQFEAPEGYELRVIVVQTRALAQTLLREVVAAHGKNFGTLAEQNSIDTTSAPEQGDLGWVTLSTLSAGAAKAASQMQVGGYAVADTPNGWDVLQLLGKRAPGRQSLRAATVAITKTLIAQHFQTSAKGYLGALAKGAKIRIFWHPVKGG